MDISAKTEKYWPTIGLEVHIEPKTRTKMFCSCRNNPNESVPNKNVCPICLGHPGMLPVANREAIKQILKLGLSLNCTIPERAMFDRKNYFYPDLPKGYQITQNYYPFCLGGALPIFLSETEEIPTVKLSSIHLEEDAGKLLHTNMANATLVDYNRAGVPLIELITEPVIHSALEARLFAESLQILLRYLNISDADMERGEMRIEVNISLAPIDADQTKVDVNSWQANNGSTNQQNEFCRSTSLGTKVEVKNINSFKAVEKAIEYEILRQTEILERGEKIVQETRGWNDAKEITASQRIKEESDDYRYFPEPDLPLIITHSQKEGEGLFNLEELKREIQELPWERRKRFINNYNLEPKKVILFLKQKELGDYFEQVVNEAKNKIQDQVQLVKAMELVYNYLTTDLWGWIVKENLNSSQWQIPSDNFFFIIKNLLDNKISSKGAKIIIEEIIHNNKKSPAEVIQEKQLEQLSDPSSLESIVANVIQENSKVVDDYKKGKENALQFLVGKVMAQTKGAANPQVIRDLIQKLLK